MHQAGSAHLDVESNAFTSFESIADWTSTTSPVDLTDEPVTDDALALSIETNGWSVVTSRQFQAQDLPPVTARIGFDLFVPEPQPNPWWTGDLQLRLTCPNAGVYDLMLGQKNMTHFFQDEYNHVSFNIPTAALSALSSGHSCRFSFVLNTAGQAGTFLLDRLGFE